ncbi:hypothetical protein LELG_05754 [Lodderomyces elongisporus NRRL YB-4239]|uniref:NDT80 domain-containing protein n=1 Tax=Lodderomyces elongisporus (strain ATCC 11503 / CBS 2605 / JCM 1781 / NBRC 1676 / NRRL YB-4239) TaxID=379508 RepID=A5H2N9_LODEL|nr:hypothetical protein LELG_05754 [Lodderomyces elongisporus NRRL YB-4239]
MSSLNNKNDRIDDLTALFLPDTLQTLQNTPVPHSDQLGSSKQSNGDFMLPKDNNNGITNNGALTNMEADANRGNGANMDLSTSTSYQDFLNSNNFINRPTTDIENEQLPYSHSSSSHYAPYLPYETSANNIQHYSNFHNPLFQQYFPQQTFQPQLMQQLQLQPQPQLLIQPQLLQQLLLQVVPLPIQQQQQLLQQPLQYMGEVPLLQLQSPQGFSGLLHTNSSSYLRGFGEYGEWINNGYTNNQTPQLQLLQLQQQQQLLLQQQQLPQQQQQRPIESAGELYQSTSTPNSPKKKKIKHRKRDTRQPFDFHIDYTPANIRRLLDFQQSGATSINDYKIIDNNNNEIAVDFCGFLNGRFFTNDTDNNNYIFTKNELQRTTGALAKEQSSNIPTTENPKVVSCYRRNYIQILMNMNLAGLKKGFKLLKLQTSEYGYTTTRVIKYFKIEIHAVTNMSNSKNVPIIIRNDIKDLEREREKEKRVASNYQMETKDDIVQPNVVSAQEHVVVLNEVVPAYSDDVADKFFVVKKLQFKNATPNNGNLTFQNYYHLKLKLSCIVADIYYDDYVDEMEVATDLNKGANNEFLLAELVSEPIIVRGRNPSFYAERKDILIKCRKPNSRKSFKMASQGAERDGGGQQDDLDDGLDHGGDNMEDDSHTDDGEGGEGFGGDSAGGGRSHGTRDFADEDDGDADAEDNLQKRGDFAYGMRYTNQAHEGGELQQHRHQPVNVNGQESPLNEAKKKQQNEQSQSQSQSQSQNQLMSSYSTSSLDLESMGKYKYFPISSHYYLPPVNVVWFPHRAHHPIDKEEGESGSSMEPKIERKSSNVYFK